VTPGAGPLCTTLSTIIDCGQKSSVHGVLSVQSFCHLMDHVAGQVARLRCIDRPVNWVRCDIGAIGSMDRSHQLGISTSANTGWEGVSRVAALSALMDVSKYSSICSLQAPTVPAWSRTLNKFGAERIRY